MTFPEFSKYKRRKICRRPVSGSPADIFMQSVRWQHLSLMLFFTAKPNLKGKVMRQLLDVHVNKKHSYFITLNDTFNALREDIIDAIGLDPSKKICIVSDSNVGNIYLNTVENLLNDSFSQIYSFVFSAGESSKNLDTARQLYTHLTCNHFDRHDFLIALGGGVVGDLTGFVAATYLRGIDFIQLPTSLLAQVDSSIGGKTGVDLAQYKNMVGAFYQPKLVYMNMEVFSTLPDEQFACGMAEEIKHGLIKNKEFYLWMRSRKTEILKKDPKTLLQMLATGAAIKQNVVENDPTEKGERALLNFGHTIGHAIEKHSSFTLNHGQCVSIGMMAAAYLSVKREFLTTKELQELEQLLLDYNLPTRVKGIYPADILQITKSDKKMVGDRIKFILLRSLGDAFIDCTVTDDELMEAINFIKE